MAQALLEAVDRAVTAALAKENGRIEAMIQAALDKQLAELVAAELETRETVSTIVEVQSVSSMEETMKTCKACGETKPATAFEKGRAVCRACRAAQVRQRQREPRPEATRGHEDQTSEPPRPSTGPGGFAHDSGS